MNSNKKNASTSEYYSIVRYVYNMNVYLRTGMWLDTHYGEKREKRMYCVCIAPAFDKDGLMKRTKGVFYRDLQKIWTNDMENFDNA